MITDRWNLLKQCHSVRTSGTPCISRHHHHRVIWGLKWGLKFHARNSFLVKERVSFERCPNYRGVPRERFHCKNITDALSVDTPLFLQLVYQILMYIQMMDATGSNHVR